MTVQTLPNGYRQLMNGEIVQLGDYLRIGESYALISHSNIDCKINKQKRPEFDCGSAGHIVRDGGTFEGYFTNRESAK